MDSTRSNVTLFSVKYSFIEKLISMLHSPQSEGIITWDGDGTAIVILDPNQFVNRILVDYYSRPKFDTFIRQLNVHRFDCYRYENSSVVFPQMMVCINRYFQRNRPELLNKIIKKSGRYEGKENHISYERLDDYFSKVVISTTDASDTPTSTESEPNPQHLVDMLIKKIISASISNQQNQSFNQRVSNSTSNRTNRILPPFQDDQIPNQLNIYHPKNEPIYNPNPSQIAMNANFKKSRSLHLNSPTPTAAINPTHYPYPKYTSLVQANSRKSSQPGWVRYKLHKKSKEFVYNQATLNRPVPNCHQGTEPIRVLQPSISNRNSTENLKSIQASLQNQNLNNLHGSSLGSGSESLNGNLIPSPTQQPHPSQQQPQVITPPKFEVKVIRHESLNRISDKNPLKSQLSNKDELKNEENDIFSIANLCS